MNSALESMLLGMYPGQDLNKIIFEKLPRTWFDDKLGLPFDMRKLTVEGTPSVQYIFAYPYTATENRVGEELEEEVNFKRDIWGFEIAMHRCFDLLVTDRSPVVYAKRYLLSDIIKLEEPPLLYNGLEFIFNEDYNPEQIPEYQERFKDDDYITVQKQAVISPNGHEEN